MSRLFVAKITKNPRQVTEDFAISNNIDWFGGIEVGDYVIVLHNRQIDKLWKAVSYHTDEVSPVGTDENYWRFKTIRKYGYSGMQQTLCMYPHFKMNLNLLNKSTKQLKNKSFFELTLNEGAPTVEEIDFNIKRRIFITLASRKMHNIQYRENDVCVSLNNKEEMRIEGIEIFKSGAFQELKTLTQLYHTKNPIEPRPTLRELLEYARNDNRKKKKNYLNKVIQAIDNNQHFEVFNPIRLYDFILVGSHSHRAAQGVPSPPTIEEEDFDETELLEYKPFVEMLDFNPNIILYGPPGTGKTYAAQRIIECAEYLKNNQFKPFSELQKEQRVEFVTFHQAFSYEEFVEGLRPVMRNEEDKEDEGTGGLEYKVEPGILKRIAENASAGQIRSTFEKENLSELSGDNKVWKVSLGERNSNTIYKQCIEKEQIAIGWLQDKDLRTVDNIYKALKELNPNSKPTNDNATILDFLNRMDIGDIVLIYDGRYTIRDIGIITSDYEYLGNKSYPHIRKVKWLKRFSTPFSIKKYNQGKQMSMKSIYQLGRISISDINEMLQSDNESSLNESIANNQPYFLIIDEINRGNIAKIFGELITLLEKDKRDSLKCTLPYSRKPFVLPSNLYVIGTMNTADRSIAVIDTALRRRFSFKEIEPEPSLIINPQLSDINNTITLDLEKLLKAINKKIASVLDRDHRIGHSYFMDIDSIKDLRNVWYLQIVPLLMEYFYNDFKSIQSIIGSNLIDTDGKVKDFQNDDTQFLNALQAIYNH